MRRAIRPIAVMLGFMFVVAVPARASSVSYSDVEQTVAIGRNKNAIRLRTVTPPQDVTVSGVIISGTDIDQNTNSDTPQPSPVAEPSNIVPVAVASQDGGNIQEIQVGDVTGTICDCGEIPYLIGEQPGGFPKYPLLALGVIPFLFLNRDSDRTPITFPPTPMPMTPTPETPIPEPATIILLGSGLAALGAGARRRRRAQADKLNQINNANVAEGI